MNNSKESLDAFICHSTKDKIPFVDSLAKELKKRGLQIWYDEDSIDDMKDIDEEVLEGLRKSKVGIVILSINFFDANYANKELAILNYKGGNRVFPIFYDIEPDHPSIKKESFLKNIKGPKVERYKYDLLNVCDRACKAIEQVKENELNKSEISQHYLINRKIIFTLLGIAFLVVIIWSTIFFNIKQNSKDISNVVTYPIKIESKKSQIPNKVSQAPEEQKLSLQNDMQQSHLESKSTSIKTEMRIDDYESFFNSSIINSENTDVLVEVIDEAGNYSYSISNDISSIYKDAGNNAFIGLFKSSFRRMPEFKALIDGDFDVLQKLNLFKHADFLALGKISFSETDGTLVANTKICSASISVNLFNLKTGTIVSSFDIPYVNGNGVTDSQAKEMAIKKLLFKYSNEHSSL